MRKSRAETARTRRRIVAAASEALRENGIRGTVLAEVMAAAGLTQGGFYRHFGSKDQLVAEACAEGAQRAVEAAADAELALTVLLDRYFSPDPQVNPLQTCPLVTLGSELPRADAQTRASAADALHQLIGGFAGQLGGTDRETAKARAMFMVCSVVGALTMSRLVPDPAFAAALLDNSRDWLERAVGP